MKRKKGRPKQKNKKRVSAEETPRDENKEKDREKERGWLALIGLLIVLFLILGCPPRS
jgi:hypothetical protein